MFIFFFALLGTMKSKRIIYFILKNRMNPKIPHSSARLTSLYCVS